MVNHGIRQWLNRVSGNRRPSASRSKRRRGRMPVALPAEILECRLLLSANHLAFAPAPASPQTAGSSFKVTIDVENSSNSVVSGSHSLVTLTESGPGSFAGAGTTMKESAVDGVAKFNVTLDKAGTYTLTATDGTLGHAVDSGLVVTADTSDAEHLAFVSVPSKGTAGLPLKTFEVVLEDQFGNKDTTSDFDGNNIVLTETGPGAFNASSQTNAYVHNGVAIFNDVILDKAGAYKLSATDADDAAIGGATFGNVTIGAGKAAKLSFEQGTTAGTALTGIAGTAFTSGSGLVVDVLDAYGNLVKSDHSVVSLSVISNPSPGNTSYIPPINLTATAVDGVATFTPTFYTGTLVFGTGTVPYLLRAYDTADGITTSHNLNSEFVDINAATATQLQFVVQPGSASSTSPVPAFEVAVEDMYGNIVTTSNALVTVAIQSGDGNQTPGSNDESGAQQGIATFSGFVVNNFGSPNTAYFTLVATSPGLTSAYSNQFSVT